ncbi:hypothetical protein K2173_017253 [Erythroxylum novogranatense]|uniref:Uncharacterized protein n=1 Tax=Erythroxylum novogranatense TaxID=1862640 RepID=A0AAV8U665_9ROSI|nr:hypothetical protein K2173_017253 [Erythroxylum novogranatense]
MSVEKGRYFVQLDLLWVFVVEGEEKCKRQREFKVRDLCPSINLGRTIGNQKSGRSASFNQQRSSSSAYGKGGGGGGFSQLKNT